SLLMLPLVLKFVAAPFVDRISPLARLGHRRGWVIPTQLLVSALIASMAFFDPSRAGPLFGLGLAIAVLSSLQDIATDGYAVRHLDGVSRPVGNAIQAGAIALGVVLGGTLALVLFDRIGWTATILIVATLSLLPLPAALWMREIAEEGRRLPGRPRATLRGFFTRPNAWIVLGFALLCISGILISGLYPAKMLSSFDPIVVLKGKFTSSPTGNRLRKILVVGQFAITIVLLTGAIVVYQQLKYVSNKDLGMTLSKIVVINPPDLYNADSTFILKERSFKEELRKLPQVIIAANSGRVPGSDLHKTFDVYRTNAGSANRVALSNMSVSEEFIELYGIRLLEGRNFEPSDYSFDLARATNVILNQSAVQLLGFTSEQEAIGKTLAIFESHYTVIGVVKNFHQKSLHSPLEPVILMANYSPHNPISVKVKPGNVANTITGIKKVYDSFFPGNIFTYQFMDETFAQQYNRDKLAGRVFAIFSGIAVMIASLGLLGLSLLATT
ncbi:MAG: hypothetical protein DI538_29060, partial [Azospira oryzae]